MIRIHLGMPEVAELWKELTEKNHSGRATPEEAALFKRLGKGLRQISSNPRHPGLETQTIEHLSKSYRKKVWQSNLVNDRPEEGRIFWTFGEDPEDIIILGFEPHPRDGKPGAYKTVALSAEGKVLRQPAAFVSRSGGR